jgi:hypothetical protein
VDILKNAQHALVLEDELHVCYLLAPMTISLTERTSIGFGMPIIKTWGDFKPAWRRMNQEQQRIAKKVARLGPWVECKMETDTIPSPRRPFIEKLYRVRSSIDVLLSKRFFAMELLELVREDDIGVVAKRYCQQRAQVCENALWTPHHFILFLY